MAPPLKGMAGIGGPAGLSVSQPASGVDGTIADGISISSPNGWWFIQVGANGKGVFQNNNSGGSSAVYYTTNHGANWTSWSLPALQNSSPNGLIINYPAGGTDYWFLNDCFYNGGGREIVHVATTIGGAWTEICDFSVGRSDQAYSVATDTTGFSATLTGNNTNTGRGWWIKPDGTNGYRGTYVSTGGPGRSMWIPGGGTDTSGDYISCTQYRGFVTTTDAWDTYTTVEAPSHPGSQSVREDSTGSWLMYYTAGSGTNCDVWISYQGGAATNITSSFTFTCTGNSYRSIYMCSVYDNKFYLHNRDDSVMQVYDGATGTVENQGAINSGYLTMYTQNGTKLLIPYS